TSIFSAISFIKTVSGTSTLTGVVTYRYDENEFVDYNYKVFMSDKNQHMIHRIKPNTIMLITGKFVLEKPRLDVTVVQAISLNLKMIDELPLIYDLLPCPPFGNYSASCKSSEINKGSTSYFTLERRTYNPLTANYLTAEVACPYNAGSTRHAGVAKATESTAIFSVCGEFYKGKNMVQIITSEIEWNNVYSGNAANTSSSLSSPGAGGRKNCNQDLMNYENRSQAKRPAKTSGEHQKSPINIEEEGVTYHPEPGLETEVEPEENSGGNGTQDKLQK
ncbi:19792_t:CDS:1, partial [Entrophospora sp. SA101]